MHRAERARVLRPRVELEGDAPLLDRDHPHADQLRRPAARSSSPATIWPEQRRRRHGSSTVRITSPSCIACERLAPAVERRGARDHAREVELAVERPLREPREVLCGRWSPPCETRIRARFAKSCGRSSSRRLAAGREADQDERAARAEQRRVPSSNGRAAADDVERRSRPAPRRCRSRRSAAPARACARRGRSRGSRTAPAMRAPWITDSPTAPQPITATRAPSQTFAVSSTDMTPVATAQPSRHACSTGSSRGTFTAATCRHDGVRRERPGAQHRRQLAAVARESSRPGAAGGRLHWRGSPRAHSRAVAAGGLPAEDDAVAGREPGRRPRRPPRSCRRPRGRAGSDTRDASRPPRSRAGRCGRHRSPRSARAPRPAPGGSTRISSSATRPRSARTTPRSATSGRARATECAPASARLRSISAIRFWISSSTPRCPPTASA